MQGAGWWALAGLVAGWLWVGQVAASPPGIEDLLRRAEFEDVRISPRGDYLALRMPFPARTVLAIMRRSDRTITATMGAGEDGFIDDVAWIGDERVLASWSRRIGHRAEPYAMSSLQVMDVDGRNRRAFHGWIADAMTHDPDRVLVVECMSRTRKGCSTRLREIGVLSRGKPRDIAEGPERNARFMLDRMGRPVFSWATSWDGDQRVFVRHGSEWLPVNDQAGSGVEVHPVGVAYDMSHGYLWSERASGPDVIERIDLADGRRTVVASDPVMDPAGLVKSFDQREVIGVRYGRGVHEIRYFDDRHPHVRLYRELEKEFRGEHVYVTSSTRDGRLVVVRVTSDREPGRYYLLDIVSGEMSRLIEHREWIDRTMLAAVEPVVFQARDGRGLDGYLTRPRKPAAGGAPLVVLVHGGPFGVRDGWGFDPEVQMLAAHGYAVMQVNFRGSSGRGRDFMESGYLQWGRGMIDDIVDGARWAQAQEGVSPSRACIWGASYGGYAALFASVREPDMFRCAIGMAAPYDLPTMYKWGDTKDSRVGKMILDRYIGADQARLREDSPSNHAAALRAELLLVHGGRDRRVPLEHARIMRRELDKAGKTHEWYLAGDETHGFHDDRAELEYYTRVFGFLGRHLPTGAATAEADVGPDATHTDPGGKSP